MEGKLEMNQNELKERLINVTQNPGLKLKCIARAIGIEQNDLCKFKHGKILLCASDYSNLENYITRAEAL